MDNGESDSPRPCTRNAKYCYRAFLEKKIRRYDTKWVGYPSSENTRENAKEKLTEVPKVVKKYWKNFCTVNKIDKETMDRTYSGADRKLDEGKVNMVTQKSSHQISDKEKKYGFEVNSSTPKDKVKKGKNKLATDQKIKEARAGVNLFGDFNTAAPKIKKNKAVELIKKNETREKIKEAREKKLISSSEEDIVEKIEKKKKKKKKKKADK